MSWLRDLKYDALSPLLHSQHPAIEYWAKKDLLNQQTADPQHILWGLPIPKQIVARQSANGNWVYPGNKPRNATDYDLLETYRQLGFLIGMFGFSRKHKAIQKAAEYVFSKQAPEGDLRGIYGNQYSPNYTAGLAELLIKAGYGQDKRVGKIFTWLESIKQLDGGWALPFRTLGRKLDAINDKQTIQPDRAKPFSHMVTGVVLRAYAAHASYCTSRAAKQGAELLSSRFFEKDVYPDRGKVEDWTGFAFPFWYTDLVSSLDSMSIIAPSLHNQKIEQAKKWLIEHQQQDGLFAGHLLKDRYHDLQLWYSLAVCRVFSRMK